MIEDLFYLLLFIICILLSAFFSSSEVALISITKARVRTLVNENKPGALALATLKENPDHFLITILIGNTIINIAAAAIATAIAISVFGSIGVGIATGFVVIVLLVFGEIGPKIYASPGPGYLCPDRRAHYPFPLPHPLSRHLARRSGEPLARRRQGRGRTRGD